MSKKKAKSPTYYIVIIVGIELLLACSLIASQLSQENRTLAVVKNVSQVQTLQQFIDGIPLEIIGMVVVILVTILVMLLPRKKHNYRDLGK